MFISLKTNVSNGENTLVTNHFVSVLSCPLCVFVLSLCLASRVTQSVGWSKLGGGGLARMQNRAMADLVSRLDQDPKAGAGTTEDARTRRRRLYRMASEQRPAFPYQHKNFFSHVMENKEVIKTLSLLSSCTHEIKPVSTSYTPHYGKCCRGNKQ